MLEKCREVRSFLALEMAARKMLTPVLLHQLLLGSTLLRVCYARVHTTDWEVFLLELKAAGNRWFFLKFHSVKHLWEIGRGGRQASPVGE